MSELKIKFKSEKEKDEFIKWFFSDANMQNMDFYFGKKTIVYNGKDEMKIG